jgi:hypothetical protein
MNRRTEVAASNAKRIVKSCAHWIYRAHMKPLILLVVFIWAASYAVYPELEFGLGHGRAGVTVGSYWGSAWIHWESRVPGGPRYKIGYVGNVPTFLRRCQQAGANV